MDGLIAQLATITGQLTTVAGVTPQSLADLRTLVTAILIQQDPGLLPVVAQPDASAEINEAAAAGVLLADNRNAANLQSRFLREHYLASDNNPEQPAHVFGPFEDNAALVQFRIVDTGTWLAVTIQTSAGGGIALTQALWLPAETIVDAAITTITLPPGTVIVRASLLVPGARGFALLRVSGGSLECGAPALLSADGKRLQLARDATWRLTVQPEATTDGLDGSDGNAVTITVPAQLEIRSSGAVTASGEIGIFGFGTDLKFDTPQGAPTVLDGAIGFSYQSNAAPWHIDGNRSPVSKFVGDGIVQSAVWAVPLTMTEPGETGIAAHGGAIGVAIRGRLGVCGADIIGHIRVGDPVIFASARGIELRAAVLETTARIDLSLWGDARGEVTVGATAKQLRFDSRRDGADIAVISGGTLRNRWDMPRAATGMPFAFAGDIIELQRIVEADGMHRTTCLAACQPADASEGLALENLYLQVRPVRSVAFAGSGAKPGMLRVGTAELAFDVQTAEPMLPDPYAANWSFDNQARPTESALKLRLSWPDDGAPTLQARFDAPVSFPEPREAAPVDSDQQLAGEFIEHVRGDFDVLGLLDLSTHEDHLGIALGSQSGRQPRIDGANRFATELRGVHLLMQPQVHWEPVQDTLGAGLMTSTSNGGRTLIGANSVKLVPVLPGIVGAEIAAVAGRTNAAAALFGLPFGLRALAFMDPAPVPDFSNPATIVTLHQPQFDHDMTAARQFRMAATGGKRLGQPRDPARVFPGKLHQTPNVRGAPPASTLPDDITTIFNQSFPSGIPVHDVDLSGYGLSCFSNWHLDEKDKATLGVIQVRFDVLIGRTAYEVIQVRSVLAPCQARVVRTTIFERQNSGRVERFDSGWQAVEDGEFSLYVPFDKGVLRGLRRIRNIRERLQPLLKIADKSEWRAVSFDADADLDGLTRGGGAGGAPALQHSGYVQVSAGAGNADAPNDSRFQALFAATGPIGGPIDCSIRLGGTLDMHLSALLADFAPDGAQRGFAIAAHGAPALPRAGAWSTVRIDGATSDISAVDPSRGVPVSRRNGQPYAFRDAADARRSGGGARAEYGLLLSTPTSRVLFPRPTVTPGANQLKTDPPRLADPVALAQASGAFPRDAFTLRAALSSLFAITGANDWQIGNPEFGFVAPDTGVASGADWAISRLFPEAPSFKAIIDSADTAKPWELAQPVHRIVLNVAGHDLMTIVGDFAAAAGLPATMPKPSIEFGSFLDDLTELVDALRGLTNFDLPIEVGVTAGPGPDPSFVVRLDLKFRIGEGPGERIDIGIGKLYGEFEISGEFQAAVSGGSHGRLKLVFQGDIQQAILPPVLYAGGLFRFAIEISDNDDPVIELGLGTTTSIGGDLIKNLLEVEATIKYGYMLIPKTLKPGVILGIEARAKLLAGLFSLSFSADAIARVERLNADKTVTIFAHIRVAASIQVAIFFEKDVDFETQFAQNLPLAPMLAIAGVNPLVAIATSAVL